MNHQQLAAEVLVQLVSYAKRVAWRVGAGQESERIANDAAYMAAKHWDPSKGVTMERFVALIAKRMVYHHWRDRAKRREEQRSVAWLEQVTPELQEEPYEELGLQAMCSPEDWALLTMYYVEKLPLDVVGRRLGGGTIANAVSVARVRKLLAAAVSRLEGKLRGQGHA